MDQAVSATSAAGPGRLELLIGRMRRGERAAAAQFIDEFGPRVRRRLRAKLSRAMRRVFDSQDLMSTFARRLDSFVLAGKLRATTEGQFWSLVFQMAEHALIDKGRVYRRLQKTEADDGPLARDLSDRLRDAESLPDGPELQIAKTFEMLPDSIDRAILSLWLNDTPHAVTAECVGLSAAAVRQRWGAIRARLRAGLEAEYGQ